MSYFRQMEFPTNKPNYADTYFCGWVIGDTHWHGAAIWDGKKFKEEKISELKGLQPTYWLAPFTGFTPNSRRERYSQQELEDLNFLAEGSVTF